MPYVAEMLIRPDQKVSALDLTTNDFVQPHRTTTSLLLEDDPKGNLSLWQDTHITKYAGLVASLF
jgi:hypothetical protein